MSHSVWSSLQIPCSLWLFFLLSFITVNLAGTELAFSILPKDGIGILNSSLMLHCKAFDSILKSLVPVTWEKNAGALKNRIHQMSNGSLCFPHLEEEDFGNYSCSAKRGNRQIQTSVLVSKACLQDVFFHPQSLRAEEGRDVFLQCVSGDSSPPAQIYWTRNGKVLTTGKQIQGQYGGGSQKKTSGTLHIAKISKADQGTYICITHNPLLNTSKESHVATLTVFSTNEDLKITEGPQNITVALEMEAALYCFVEGFPPPLVQWFKDGHPLYNSSRWDLQKDGQLLILLKVLPEDEGLYFCEAHNEREKVMSQSAYLRPEEKDWSYSFEVGNRTARKGESFTLPCWPPHSPPARVTWFKNKRPLEREQHYTVDASGNLIFHSLKETDRGVYFCQASKNIFRRALTSQNIFLDIVAPPSVTIWPALQTSLVGSEVAIHCQVSGHPAPFIRWSKQGRSVQTGGKIIMGLRNTTLYIASVRIYDEGHYTCSASNMLGLDEKTMTLRVAADSGTTPHGEPLKKQIKPTVTETAQKVFADSFLHGPKLLSNTEKNENLQQTTENTSRYWLNAFESDSSASFSLDSFPNPTELSSQQPVGISLKSNEKRFEPIETQTSTLVSATPPPFKDTSVQVTNIQTTQQVSKLPVINPMTDEPYSHTQIPNSESFSPNGGKIFKPQTQPADVGLMNVENITHLATVEQHQNLSQQAKNNTDLVETPRKNSSQAPMRTSDSKNREKETSQTWWPVIEKHDIPIVVGVGVSLAFIFITMAFYSLVQKNDPAAITTGRGALRCVGGPCRQGERLSMENAYDNKAFEDDNCVAVIEQSPNSSETRALPIESIPSILMMIEPVSDDVSNGAQSIQELPVIVETHPVPREEEQLETVFEEGKLSDVHLQCVEDWRSRVSEPCMDFPSPEALRSSLSMQTPETPTGSVRHSISISHGLAPILLSHSVTLGSTSVAVDVHLYPSAVPHLTGTAFGAVGQNTN